jgi:hypothetical protein
VSQENAYVPDPTATLPFKRHSDSDSDRMQAVEAPTSSPASLSDEGPSSATRRRQAMSQFSAVSFVLGLLAGVSITSAVAGMVFVVMMLVG